MKIFHLLLLLFLSGTLRLSAQPNTAYKSADAHALKTIGRQVAPLAVELTRPFTKDSDKVRAIFRWITQNISYDLEEYFSGAKEYKGLNLKDVPDDSVAAEKQYNLAVAEMVLQKRKAICDGYSRLFKVMCNSAGINCEVITGCGRPAFEENLTIQYTSNHAWNAVMLENEWKLLDVTWASGYCDLGQKRFTRALNEQYFLAPAERFIYDHYPDTQVWQLLSKEASLDSFLRMPGRTPALWSAPIISYGPNSGLLRNSEEMAVFEFHAKDTITDAMVYTSQPTVWLMIVSKPKAEMKLSKLPNAQIKLPQRRVYITKPERDAIDAIMGYIDTAHAQTEPAPFVDAKAKNIPESPKQSSFTISGNVVKFNCPVSDKRLKEVIVTYNGEALLRYQLVR